MTNYCIDCKHYEARTHAHACTSPKLGTKLNYVTGQNRKIVVVCGQCRYAYNMCNDGEWYEAANPSLWQKLVKFLRRRK